MIPVLVPLAVLCLLGLAAWFPAAATICWILVLESSPDEWLAAHIGGREAIIAVMKTAGLVLAALMMLRFGAKRDRYNPAFAYAAMFVAGLAHGLYPGLGVLDSLRSFIGSAAPFLFGFARLPGACCRAVIWAVRLGPLCTVIYGACLSAAGIYPLYGVIQGAIRLGGSGEPSFLGGFTLIAIYAGLHQQLRGNSPANAALLLLNLTILLATGARAPLALAVILITGTALLQRRFMLLAGMGAALCLAIIFASTLDFIRVVDLVELGEAANLSHRDLAWPIFEQAFLASPWTGWGAGAGKAVIPVRAGFAHFIGTNAAHNEYLRIATEGGALGLALLIGLMTAWAVRGSRALPSPELWLMRAIFCAFAIHSATDNTLIATTSSVFFIWIAAVFATGEQESKPPA
jgi:O-antigen ligase